MSIIYGDGTLYGAAEADYGRISASIISAQASSVRETGLKVTLIDERVNEWEFLTGTPDDPTDYAVIGMRTQYEQDYWSYRGTADMCILDDGTIVRVRNNIDDQSVEVQEITDPTVAAQWEAWTTYNGDVNFAVAIAPDGNNYIIYHTKANGLYRNNSLVWAMDNLMRIDMHRSADGRQVKDALWVMRVDIGHVQEIDGVNVSIRKFDGYWTDDVVANDPVEVDWNWAWQRHQITSIEREDGQFLRYITFPLYVPSTALNTGDSITVSEIPLFSSMPTMRIADFEVQPPRLIRGLGGDIGHNYVSGAKIFRLDDGYLYMFYNESHANDDFEAVSNLLTPLVWQRSKDGVHWGEPVHMGFNLWGFAGLVETVDAVYLAGYSEVYKRPSTPVEYDLSNYVPEVSWESPRDNQTGTGDMVVANPDNIHAAIEKLNDSRVIIEPGIKTETGQFEFARLDDFWSKRIKKDLSGKTNRLTIEFGNIWSRLENPLRDVYNFIGQTQFVDWRPSGTNQPFQYYADTASDMIVTHDDWLGVVGGGRVLWTGWKGYNPTIDVEWRYVPGAGTPMIFIFRYVDENNYIRCELNNSGNLTFIEKKDGLDGATHSFGSFGTTSRRIKFKWTWKRVDVYRDDVWWASMDELNYPSPLVIDPGYVGWEAASDFNILNLSFFDYEFDYKSEHLIKQALAVGDYFDVKIGSALARQYALTWGPQTDLPTAADALRQLLEGEKLELIWRDGFIEIGQFKEEAPVKTIEDRIINTTEIGEANRRINLANVDGNEDTWFEVDVEDAKDRGRMLNAYFDLPELLEEDAVRNRAIEEIRRGKLGQSPGGSVPLFFDIWRMDPLEWVDAAGTSKLVRVEGLKVTINQSNEPSQREEIDTSLI